MSENISSIEQDKVFVHEYNNGRKNSAFSKIYEKYHAKIRFKFLISCRDEDLADDLASEVFVKVYENLSTFDDEKACLNTWISTVATYHHRDYLKKRYVKNVVSMDMSYGDDERPGAVQFPSDSLTPFQIVNKLDMKKTVRDIVELSLKNETMRTIVDMRFFREMSMQEMADETQIPLNTVKIHLHRAKGIMAKYIEEKGGKEAILY